VPEDRGVLSDSAPAGPVSWEYGEHPDQVVEMWPGGPHLVVLLHGGFWREEYDRSHLRGAAAELSGEGITVALPEYRRVGGAGGWPQTFDDVASLMAQLPTRAPASAVVLAGHSAGGHLALWAASASPPPDLVGVVALAPVADLLAADRARLDGDAVAALLGAAPETAPDRYRWADPVQRPTPGCPVRLLHARDDTLVPIEQSRAYARRHPGARLDEVPGGHFGVVDPGSAAWPAVTAAVGELWPPGRG
jgi:acetyl esterase/lipase